MTEDRWRPLWAREPSQREGFDALAEGVPPWLRQALVEWVDENFLYGHSREGRVIKPGALRSIELNVRIGLNWKYGVDYAHVSLWSACDDAADVFLSVVDLALRDLGGDPNMRGSIDRLDGVLRVGGSRWMVAPDRRGLVERVQPEAAEAARQVIESGSRAGEYLAEAWRHTYGRSPNPGSAYREAVRAVEAAVCPVVIPRNTKATLGLAITSLRDAPPGKFTTVFPDNAPGVKPIDAVRDLMSLVWTSQLDRHGTADTSVPLNVSPDQAEAVLHAAVTLVQWFQRGFVRAT